MLCDACTKSGSRRAGRYLWTHIGEQMAHSWMSAQDYFIYFVHEQMEVYLEEAMTPFEDETMPVAPLPQEIDRQFFIIPDGPRKGKLYGLSTIASTIYPQAMTLRPRGSTSLGQSIYASREEARESREKARAATQRAKEAEERAKEAEERAIEARQECEELRSRVSSLEESVRLLFGGMPCGSHSGHSLHGRGSSQAGRGSSHSTMSSTSSREGSRASLTGRGSPMDRCSAAGRSAHISRSFQGRAPSNHIACT